MVKTIENILSYTDVAPKNPQPTVFWPPPPDNLAQTGLNNVLLEDLISKLLLQHDLLSGKKIADALCIPLLVFSDLLYDMKKRLLVTYHNTAGINDFVYTLSEQGRHQALTARESSAYAGAAPVRYKDYLQSISQQSLKNEQPNQEDIQRALDGLILSDSFYSLLGPAINSGRGLFLYGNPGNGKTEVAMKLASCFQESVFIPKTLLIEGQLVKLYDPQCHNIIDDEKNGTFDQRWIRIARPAVTVGGEMDMSSLEIGYNSRTKVCEASLQMKGNSGVFVIDDFGRQKVSPEQLLNRWILPLEKRIDYLTLPSGTKFQVPFDALLVFCTNLDPVKLLDEAFLRRIPYKICMTDPSEEEFRTIFHETAARYNIPCSEKMVDYLLVQHFRGVRTMRGCHPRDILRQLVNIALFEDREPQMKIKDIDKAVQLYFSATQGKVKN